ncbi:Uncharacterised protein [uncultured Clostridium sp.]|nr:Uncharacterised protein [uncultured Clostridium sp.]
MSRNFTVALETGTGDGELAKVNALPAHRLLGSLLFPSAVAFDGGVNITGTGTGTFIPVRAARAEGLTDPRGALELDGADVVHGHAGFGHAEEVGDALAKVVGHLDAHGVDARRGHGELKRTGFRVVLPHIEIGRVLDAVDRHAVDGAPGQVLKRLVIGREGHLGGRGGDGEGDLALTGHVAAHVGGGAVEVEGDLCGLIRRGVDELDTGGFDDGLSLIVLLRIELGHVHEAGGLIHDEPIAHIRIGVVLGGEPFGQLRAGDVGTCPAHIVIRLRVNLE